MDAITILGLLAAALTTVSFLPQVIKTIRTRQAKDLSMHMYAVFVFGVVLWAIYGFILGNIPLIAANLVTAVLAGIILFLKIRYG